MVELIEKKKLGNALNENEIKYIINSYTKGEIPDYQMSALAMAIYFQSMDKLEIAYLTDAMKNSGECYDLSAIPGFKADKHSSGGVGDKISLIYGPLVASFGVKVAKMSGRGLGITGGTIDKLESFPGFKVEIPFTEFVRIVNKTNMSIIAQSGNIVPADKKIYALRDVTSTTDSIPLMAASIMCKKLATGSDGIILDVKCGSGAFMKNLVQARELASIMVEIGKHFGKKVTAEITNMDQPLGRAIGNLIEVYEAAETLRGNGPDDLNELVCHSAAVSLVQAGLFDSTEAAYQAATERLMSSEALKVYREFITEQGGDFSVIEAKNIDALLHTKFKYEIKAPSAGYVDIFNTNKLGWLSLELGAGRKTKEDAIDHFAGIYINRKTGEKVAAGDVILTLYTNQAMNLNFDEVRDSILKISSKPIKMAPLVLDTVE